MLRILSVCLFSLFASSAFAAANCPAYPAKEWMKKPEARKLLEAQGFKIRTFKVDGNCYEIYAKDKQGKKVEIYFDAKTLAPIKTIAYD